MLTELFKLPGGMLAGFLRGATDVRVGRPWPKAHPDLRLMRFLKDGENYVATYDMSHKSATIFLRTDDEEEAMEATA